MVDKKEEKKEEEKEENPLESLKILVAKMESKEILLKEDLKVTKKALKSLKKVLEIKP